MKQLLTIREAAAILRCSRERTYELAARGEIPTVRISERRIRVPADALEDWIAERTVGVKSDGAP
jgi:excisionase family DNA binding protein